MTLELSESPIKMSGGDEYILLAGTFLSTSLDEGASAVIDAY